MVLESYFVLDAPIEDAWAALNDPERVAPCFPGATLTEYTGDSFTGTVKVKLGPISLIYRGTGTYVSRDGNSHSVVIKASGRDSRGNGTADATVTGSLVAEGPSRTRVNMTTDMAVTGRPAQFGRGVMADVSDSIMRRFADRLAATLSPEKSASPFPGTPTDSPVPTPHGPVAPASGDDPEAINLLGTAGGPVLRRVAPIALGLIMLILAVRVLRR
jgi:uncharacterized protein